MKKLSYLFATSIFLILPMVASAVPRPDLYPNKHLNEVGPERARSDINACRIAGEDYEAQQGKSPARGVLKQAAGGAALGALGGAIMGGKAGRGAGAGAAIAGVKGVAGNHRERKEGSPEYKKYVEACLEDRGYKVVGWKS